MCGTLIANNKAGSENVNTHQPSALRPGGTGIMRNTRKNILYIENNKNDRMFFMQFAATEKLLGYDYIIAGSVKEAIDLLERENFDGVVLNYPPEDATAFEQFEKENTAPVILVMSASELDIPIGAPKVRADSYLIKDHTGNYLKTLRFSLESAIKQNKDDKEIKKLRTDLRNYKKLAEERIIEMQKEINAQKQQQDQFQVFHRFAEASSQGIVIATVNGIIIYCNPALAKILGEDNPEAATGKSLFVYYPENIQQRLKNEILPAVLQEGHWVGELGLQRVNGDVLPSIENYLFVIRGRNNNPLYLANLLTDNTEQKRAEQVILHQHNMQSVLTTMSGFSLKPYPLIEMLENILDRITAVPWLTLESRRAIFLVEDKSDTLFLKSSRRLLGDMQTKCAQVPFGTCYCGQAASTKKIQFTDSVSCCLENREGPALAHGLYCVPILSAGRVLGVMALSVKEGHRRNQEEEDFLLAIANELAGLIERKNVEEEKEQLQFQLAQARKLETIGRLAGGIAQDFNNILSAIIGYAELALFEMSQNDPHRDTIENIYHSGQKAAVLIKQLMSVRRKQIIKPEILCLNAIVEDMQMILVRMISQDRGWTQ